MSRHRPHAERIERYAGPYERWVFTDELGRPFAFPPIATGPTEYYTALMEGEDRPQGNATAHIRLPPLWNPSGEGQSITPFAFHNQALKDPAADLQIDVRLSRMLGAMRAANRSRSRFRINFPISDKAWVPNYEEGIAPVHWRAPASPPKAIIGVIDDGLPFAHQCFLDRQRKTRISHCWLQAGCAEQQAGIPFGRELVNADIDALRTQFPGDERQLYRAAGAVSPTIFELGNHLMHHATHGAHVLGLAAGNSSLFPDHELDDDIQIIAVQLPNTIAWDTSGFGKEMHMLSALHYIFERAKRIADHFQVGELPLIVNFSYGWSAGRHDGQSEMATAIEELLMERQALQPATAIVMPVGNNFQSGMHSRFSEDDFEQTSLQFGWHLQPDDRTSSYLELWFPEGFDPSGYSLTLSSPLIENRKLTATIDVCADPDLDPNDDGDPRRFAEIEDAGKVIGQLSADYHQSNRWRLLIALIPTVYQANEPRRAPSGTWTVTLNRLEASLPLPAQEDVLVWLQRDDDPSNLKTQGRQSYLVPLAGDRHTWRPEHPYQIYGQKVPNISGHGALNAVSCSSRTTRVAGYTKGNGLPARYSGAGGLRPSGSGDYTTWGVLPDVSSVSDLNTFLPGISSIGTTSGSRSKLIGTSAAAPTVARLMVRNAAAGRALLEGFEPGLPFPGSEDDTTTTRSQHRARVGLKTAPMITRPG